MSKSTYMLIISYDGTPFSGWQIQPNATTIQELIQKALKTLFKEPISLVASGRTDAGVHALAQVAHIRLNQPTDPERLLLSLNGLLPPEIRIQKVHPVSPDFHARFSAERKTYIYHLQTGHVHNPFEKKYNYHFRRPLDLDLLKSACKLLEGTHDFSAFANEQNRGAAAHLPVKTIYRVSIDKKSDGLTILFEGSGFLYKMVRNMVGTLLDVASQKRPITDIPLILESKDRKLCSRAAPAHGLFLKEVRYPSKLVSKGIIC